MISGRQIAAYTICAAILVFAQPVNSQSYRLDVIARSGQAGLLGMGDNASINHKACPASAGRCSGDVAFVGQLAAGEGVFVGDGTSDPSIISPSLVSSTRRFGRAVQINNKGIIVSRDQVSGAPPASFIRFWNKETLGFAVVARGGSSGGSAFDSVSSHPSINNNIGIEDLAAGGGNDDGTCDAGEECLPLGVFSAFTGATNYLATPIRTPLSLTDKGQQHALVVSQSPLRPMISDDGRIVVRDGVAQVGAMVVLYDYTLTSPVVIASPATGFSNVGLQPGISDDGRIVVFYGELSEAGATALGTTSGPGIFAWVDDLCVSPGQDGVLETVPGGDDKVWSIGIRSGIDGRCDTTASGNDRQLVRAGVSSGSVVRVAGVGGNGRLEPGETCLDENQNQNCDAGEPDIGLFASFDADSRVGVNSVGTVAFTALDPLGTRGLYTVNLAFVASVPGGMRAAVTSVPTLVISVGTPVTNVGSVQNLSLHDPINDSGELAFWISSDTGQQAIIRAVPQCPESNYSNPTKSLYINQYNAGVALTLPSSSGGVVGGNACGPTSLTMLLNSYRLANGAAKRGLLFSADDYATPDGGDPVSIYGQTMEFLPQNGIDNKFLWDEGLTYVQHLGYDRAVLLHGNPHPTVRQLKARLDDSLAQGTQVLVSTTYSTKPRNAQNRFGGGHVVLFIGRTLNGDYIVQDPAGDYFAGSNSVNEHYGLQRSCGAKAIYPEQDVKQNLAIRETQGPLAGALVSGVGAGTTNNLDEAKGRFALAVPPTSAPDPDGLLISGRSTDTGPRPYELWVEDDQGRRAGWLPGGTPVSEIPNSTALLEPLAPSDPDSEEAILPESSWPYSVSISDPRPGLRVFIRGNRAADYSVKVLTYSAGRASKSIVSGVITAGETKSIAIPGDVHGDLDGDGDVDRDDLNVLLRAKGTAVASGDPRDLDQDGSITALDARQLTTLCSRPRCATQ